MKIFENGKYREMTAEEIAEQKAFKPTQSYEERVEMLIRQKYSVSAELAILRQRDSKPEEFAEYFDYAEQCKAKAKEILGIL